MSGATQINIAGHSGTGTVSYTDTGLLAGTTYYYRVRSTIDGTLDSRDSLIASARHRVNAAAFRHRDGPYRYRSGSSDLHAIQLQ